MSELFNLVSMVLQWFWENGYVGFGGFVYLLAVAVLIFWGHEVRQNGDDPGIGTLMMGLGGCLLGGSFLALLVIFLGG